jgi:hypothetical protein
MKKNIIYLQMTALFLTAALQGAVAAEMPFRGSFQAVETDTVQFPTLTVAGIGTGNAAQLGKFTMTYAAEVNLVTRVGIGSFEFIAANGDRVFASADFIDSDNDGLNNYQESVTGTDPTNSVSVLQMLSPTTDSSGVVVRWESVGNRFYFLERSTNLAVGYFSSIASYIPGQPGTTSFVDTNATTGAFFYRVGVQQ